MTDEETKDLEVLRDFIKKEKVRFYDMCRSVNQADARTLEIMGQRGKTQGEAMQHYWQYYEKIITKAINAHERKYPD